MLGSVFVGKSSGEPYLEVIVDDRVAARLYARENEQAVEALLLHLPFLWFVARAVFAAVEQDGSVRDDRRALLAHAAKKAADVLRAVIGGEWQEVSGQRKEANDEA